ncbi:MAG TPA: cyclic nucleotide-binding domain-containing protein [Kofleriaceae bacterium]|nr:cyclic nucleotide-binding domain-containing protein [Kofleriaceae bacterium]
MATTAAARPALRSSERALVATAGSVFALASAGAAMAAAAADGLFLAEVGRDRLGVALAVSSALLAGVLAVAGGFADRLERRRVLGVLALASAALLAALGLAVAAFPGAVAWTTYIGGKQLAAATDLAFWVAIAERVDARRSPRVLPLLAATGGAGAAIGAALVGPIASFTGTRGVLVAAAVALALAAAGSARLGAGAARLTTMRASRGGVRAIARAWADGARAVRRYPLAAHLAAVVAVAGAFGSLAYMALGYAVAARSVDDPAQLASLFGAVRAVGQVLTLAVQLAIASRLLSRLGTGRTLLVAPAVALLSGLGLVAAPILAVAAAAQIAARVVDAGLETPTEKVALALLPTNVRGRAGGFLEGPAKRLGATLGGVLAAVLVAAPTAFYASVACAAALWLVLALRISRELPSLAIAVEHGADDADDAIDGRAIAALVRELASDRPDRAAELLARLHGRGKVDAVGLLVDAATTRPESPAIWRALIGVLTQPSPSHGPKLLAAAATPLAVRAVGLAGGVDPRELARWRESADVATSVIADVAALRLADDRTELRAVLLEASRDRGPVGAVALDELCIELARERDPERTLAVAQLVVRSLGRGAGKAAARAHAFAQLGRALDTAGGSSGELALLRASLLELVRERIDATASRSAPDHALVSLMRTPDRGATRSDDPAPEIAASLRVLAALPIEADDLRRLATALGEPDDEIRAAAEAAFRVLGSAGTGELIETLAWGRRRARDRAAALLGELPVTSTVLDRLILAELDALDATDAALATITDARAPVEQLLARRLAERLHEIAHTVLLIVAAQQRSPAVARAAVLWRHAHGAQERARTLAVIEAALPRGYARRVVDAVDELAPGERAAAVIARGHELPSRDAVVRAELAGRDRLARALVLHAVADRSAYRAAIGEAARGEALAANPAELAKKLARAAFGASAAEAGRAANAQVDDEGATEMPSRVETLIALGKIPLLATLTTRQLADVGERARWISIAADRVVVGAGDPIDALIVVADGELAFGDRTIAAGQVVDELACVAPVVAVADLVTKAPSRLVRLERVDFEELVDDVPGLAAAMCRALGERARR